MSYATFKTFLGFISMSVFIFCYVRNVHVALLSQKHRISTWSPYRGFVLQLWGLNFCIWPYNNRIFHNFLDFQNYVFTYFFRRAGGLIAPPILPCCAKTAYWIGINFYRLIVLHHKLNNKYQVKIWNRRYLIIGAIKKHKAWFIND